MSVSKDIAVVPIFSDPCVGREPAFLPFKENSLTNEPSSFPDAINPPVFGCTGEPYMV